MTEQMHVHFKGKYYEEFTAQYKIKDAGVLWNSEIYDLFKDINIVVALKSEDMDGRVILQELKMKG